MDPTSGTHGLGFWRVGGGHLIPNTVLSRSSSLNVEAPRATGVSSTDAGPSTPRKHTRTNTSPLTPDRLIVPDNRALTGPTRDHRERRTRTHTSAPQAPVIVIQGSQDLSHKVRLIDLVIVVLDLVDLEKIPLGNVVLIDLDQCLGQIIINLLRRPRVSVRRASEICAFMTKGWNHCFKHSFKGILYMFVFPIGEIGWPRYLLCRI